ncbi:response regulator transcription factor [Aquimarina brevivitae]|uniref:LuxR family two component transcriptional regulator n=1 Tax=Aquimarina brevivitae TaxID=323412 RepID=A0A4Q7PL32_9FLAO|nr:response regulator transcription factor [Aquimarina brevivitae]RZS99672.1 LuxR family two component transcriptional regulator [Aquimarina brevivitae]
MKNSVVIVEDHALFSQALTSLVNSLVQYEVLFTVKNGAALLKSLKKQTVLPDIILMDIIVPAYDGLETISALKIQYPRIKVLVLSKFENKKIILKTILAGAKGYLPKDAEKGLLRKALIELQDKGFFHTKEVAELLIGALHPATKSEVELKDRELEFVKQACTEKTYKEIAQDMCVSPKTIEGYRDAIFEKLNLKNRTGMVLYAIKNHIFSP